MPENASNPLLFFQELKRRKVIRVIIVYAAASFVILELASIIQEPFGLPDWTIRLVFLILFIGLIITIILSWIYDISSKGGIVKTDRAHKVTEEDTLKSSNNWKIASYISFLVIVALIFLNIIPRKNQSGKRADLEKSIAVIPFIDDSPNKDNDHIINGIMEELIINLQSIKDLKVPGRTSIEQYRDNPKAIPEIARELGVNYIVEGSGQKYGNTFTLRVQLVEGKSGMHHWGKSLKQEILRVEDIASIQSRLALSIAEQLEVIITPEEQQRIEQIPTTSLTAYELYQKGQEEYYKYYTNKRNREALENAEIYFPIALEFDSSFAKVYTGLAWMYVQERIQFWDYPRDDYLDSVMSLANTALSYDDQLADGYALRGICYRKYSKRDQAIGQLEKALGLNPNHWSVYSELGWYHYDDDFVKSIVNFHKAESLIHGPELPAFLRRNLSLPYNNFGFFEKSEEYNLEALRMDGDLVAYYERSGYNELNHGNFQRAIEALEKMLAIDSTHYSILYWLAQGYIYLGQDEKSLEYLRKWFIERSKDPDFYLTGNNLLGYAYWKNGFREEAAYHYNESLKYLTAVKERDGMATTRETYYDLARIYLFLGEKDQAYENLRMFSTKKVLPRKWWVTQILFDPLFDSIRDEPEFQQIVRDVEAKYQAEHERVQKWLVENDML